MRTTISIDNSLLLELKERASSEGTTVSKLIEGAVRTSLASAKAESNKPDFRLVTFGKGCDFTDQNIDKPSRLMEVDDIARFG